MDENPYKTPANFDKPLPSPRWSWPNRYEWLVVGIVVFVVAALLLPAISYSPGKAEPSAQSGK